MPDEVPAHLEKVYADWKARMEALRKREEREEEEQAERDRQAYLKRTGRTELKP